MKIAKKPLIQQKYRKVSESGICTLERIIQLNLYEIAGYIQDKVELGEIHY
ncbi:MAG: hypothetical protein IPH97_06010 [Ignavibacteriales bacterium]|nr:hypothetical protein [Ignavibacteriales bacterium]